MLTVSVVTTSAGYDLFAPMTSVIERVHKVTSDGCVVPCDGVLPGSIVITVPSVDHAAPALPSLALGSWLRGADFVEAALTLILAQQIETTEFSDSEFERFSGINDHLSALVEL